MTPERWDRIKELFESALEQDSAERASFLAEACGRDEDLRAQVVQLLAQHESARDFLEHPLVQVRDLAFTSRPDRSVFAAEQVVGGRFRIVKTLGQGGMGEVYEAFDLELRDSVALKTIRHDIASDSRFIERFKQEVQRSRTVSHPNVCRVYDLFRERASDDTDVWFLTMELLRGETLSDLLHRERRLETTAALPLVKQMCDALDAAHHSGVVHRDFKSGNVMLLAGPHDSEIRVVVTDFGLAKAISATGTSTSSATGARTSSLDDLGRVLGTPAYMAPEQLEGKAATAASDLYALGIVMYEMVTGTRPFVGNSAWSVAVQRLTEPPVTPRAHVPDLEPRWEQTILRCLERDPARRFASAGAVSRALDSSASLQRSESDPLIPARGDRFKNNLPQQLTRFIGRQRELAEIRDLWTHTRLVTISGPGGIGKTRLALQIAAESLPEYEDGIWFVALDSLADADLVPQTVAATLGIRDEGSRSIGDTLADYFKHRRLLLVLDNCEHLISACAQLTDMLLRSAGNLRVLATSREPLAIAGETVFRVSSLGLPDPQRLPDLESLSKHEAVELFLDRARSVKSTFAINSGVALPLATLCVQLEGIPLAIELAASRVRVLSVAQIAARLHDRLNLLTGGSRTAMPRHQTLVAAIDWSYNLLSEPEKSLFRRLSVFSGGWTLEAAETVCPGNGLDAGSVLELLSELVGKSLVLAEEREGQTRYRFMETLLEYARKRLMHTEEGEAISRAHSEFIVALAVEGDSKLVSPEQKTWLERLNAEYNNIRAALIWTSKNNVEMGLRLAGVLGRFWYLQGHWDEARRWLTEMLEAPGAFAHRAQRVRALNAAARIAQNQGEYVSARTFSTEALTLSRESGDRRETGMALNCLAILAGKQGDFSVARALLEEALTIRRELGDRGWVGMTLINLGNLALREGQMGSARSLYQESLSISKEVDYKHGIATVLLNLGDVARRMGDHAAARSLIDQGLALAKDLGDKTLIPNALNSLGDLAGRQGDNAAARALLTDGLEMSRELGDKRLIADLLLSLGVVAEDDPTARALFEESLAIRRELGFEIAIALNRIGSLAARQGDYAAARPLHEEGLALCQQSGAKDGVAQSLEGLADVARLQGDHAQALSLYKRSLTVWRELGEEPEFLQPLEHLAAVLKARGQHDRAVRLWGAAQACRDVLSVPRAACHTDDYNRQVSAARTALGEEGFAAMWAEGQAMGADQAIAYELQDESCATR